MQITFGNSMHKYISKYNLTGAVYSTNAVYLLFFPKLSLKTGPAARAAYGKKKYGTMLGELK
jgi:hypothetical protein